MKKVLFLITSLLILGLIFAGCSLISNINTPTAETEGMNFLSRSTIIDGRTCEGFEDGFSVEDDVTGPAEIYDDLDISCPGDDMTLKVIKEDGSFSGYNYRALDNSLKNNGHLNGVMGFSVVPANSWSLGSTLDFNTIVFDFINGVTVSDFSIYMLDYGDMCHNIAQSGIIGTTHKTYKVTLNAYDESNTIVGTDEFFIDNDSEAGQGKLKYDASKTDGRITLKVAGSGIAKVEMVFTEGIDIGVGFDDICFTVEPTEVPIDIKPTSCPNPLNTKSNGVIPVAILGTADFDVTLIDPDTVLLEGISPLRWDWEDVATPFEPYTGKEYCELDCNTLGPDGFLDLTLKFDTQELLNVFRVESFEVSEEELNALEGGIIDQVTTTNGEALYDGRCLVIELVGQLVDGTYIVGEDVVRILVKGK